MTAKLPSFQFYPGDWRKDPDLRRCSPAARGVWMDMLCLMFECDERGVLVTDGKPWSHEDIAEAVGGNPRVVMVSIQELIDKAVARIRDDSAVYCKRMVEDEAARRNGGERVRKHRGNGVVTPMKHQNTPNVAPPSSSSSSSSPPSPPSGGDQGAQAGGSGNPFRWVRQ